tara:strand:+ start:8234 stop:9178 length:945 start_codon:yes stop_codon:yes gene_type:complete
MEFRTLGKTGLNVSLLSLGTGGARQLGQSQGMSQAQQTTLVRSALDLGVNLIDTSSEYGESETILGHALKEVPRDHYNICTKWPPWVDGQLAVDPTLLVNSLERSLKRLQTDHVEILLFHGPRANEYHNLVERFYPTMEKLQSQGKIGSIGLSTQYAGEPAQTVANMALKENPDIWDTIMLKYGILNQAAAQETLPLAMKNNVGIMNMAAVRVKLPDPTLLQELIIEWAQQGYIEPDSLPVENPLNWLVHDDVISVVGAGYKFAADHPAVATVITGTSNISHLKENAVALEKPYLSPKDTNLVKKLFSEINEYV